MVRFILLLQRLLLWMLSYLPWNLFLFEPVSMESVSMLLALNRTSSGWLTLCLKRRGMEGWMVRFDRFETMIIYSYILKYTFDIITYWTRFNTIKIWTNITSLFISLSLEKRDIRCRKRRWRSRFCHFEFWMILRRFFDAEKGYKLFF